MHLDFENWTWHKIWVFLQICIDLHDNRPTTYWTDSRKPILSPNKHRVNFDGSESLSARRLTDVLLFWACSHSHSVLPAGQRTDSARGRCGTVASAASDCSSLCDVTEEMKGEVVAVVVITADTNGNKKLLCLPFCHPISGVCKSFWYVCQMHLKLFFPLGLNKLMVSNKCDVT